MPVFEYKGLDSAGAAVAGIIDADTAKVARSRLRKQGLFPTDIHEQVEGGTRGSGLNMEIDVAKYFQFISSRDVSILTTQMATLIGAHIPMAEALTALVDQVEKAKLKIVMSKIKERVNEGSTLADAMADHPRVFNDLYVQMVRAGEKSGALDQVLRQSEVTLNPQPPSRYYPTIRLRDIVIDWDDTAASIACLVRACNPNHFAETVFRDLVVRVIEVTVTDRRRDTVFMPDGSVPAPGALNLHQHQLYCAASDFILRVDVVGVQDKIVGSGGRFAAIVGLRQGERFVNIASLPRFQHLLDK